MSITESFSIWPLAWETIRVSNLTEFLEKSLIRLPIIVPVVWAALTVSKRRSEMHRLAEEYAHKEALAKSYEGFKQQIIDMDINTNINTAMNVSKRKWKYDYKYKYKYQILIQIYIQ